jgi:hypothetical protein
MTAAFAVKMDASLGLVVLPTLGERNIGLAGTHSKAAAEACCSAGGAGG